MHWVSPIDRLPNITDLRQACQSIEDWVLKADGDDFSLLLDALQIEVHAEKGRGELKGLIPDYAPRKSDSDVCALVVAVNLSLGKLHRALDRYGFFSGRSIYPPHR